eukprot:210323-Ditylum_brightwellii.AAC.1
MYFQLKEESVGPPKIYLGGNVQKRTLDNGIKAWAFSSLQYCQTAVKNVAEYLEQRNDSRWTMTTKAKMPMRVSYRLELDIKPVLSLLYSTYY